MKLTQTEKSFIYKWFSNVLGHELSESQLQQYQKGVFEPLFMLLSEQGFDELVQNIKQELNALKDLPFAHLELAADFTELFLLSGETSALPYSSVYLEEDKLFDHLAFMDELLVKFQLQVNRDNKEPSDHICVYLEVLGKFVDEGANEEETEFVHNYLLPWLKPFNKKLQKITTKTKFYQNVMTLLVAVLTK